MLLRQLPATSRTARAQGGEILTWDTPTHLLATIVDLLAAANWQRGGGRGSRPRPVERPGVDPRDTKSRTIGDAIPIDEARDQLRAWGRGE